MKAEPSESLTADRPPRFAKARRLLRLLAIREFAPRSMVWLGSAFLLVGLAGFACSTFVYSAFPYVRRIGASGLMAATFGGFHLLYGAAIVTTTPRERPGA